MAKFKELLEEKIVTRYEYHALKEVKKIYDAGDLPSVTKVFQTVDHEEHANFLRAMKDPNHPITKAVRAGTNAHNAIETGVAKDALSAAVLDTYEKDLMPQIDEIWSFEKGLYHPSGYVGKFDAVGILNGTPTLWDYKKTNKKKTPSQMKKYFMQCVAYADAHNWMYGSDINQIGILNIYGKEAGEVASNITVLGEEEIRPYRDEWRSYLTRFVARMELLEGY